MNVRSRIENLRTIMREKSIDAYIIPTGDPHGSEYIGDYWKARQWLSGFTGSAGTLVVTLNDSGLWTDGRYFIQAEQQLEGSGIELYKMGQPNVPSYDQWIFDTVKENGSVGIDGKLFSFSRVREMREKLYLKNIKLNIQCNLIDAIWHDRPCLTKNNIINHNIRFAGKSSKEKLEDVRSYMKDKNTEYYILTSLDDIAWLFNIRGNDIPNNPVVAAYSIITSNEAKLFIDKVKVTDAVRDQMEVNEVEIINYDEVTNYISKINEGSRVYIDPKRVNSWIVDSIPEHCIKVEEDNITTKLKSIKNPVEIENLKRCQIKDGVAMVKFLYWLHSSLNNETITERNVCEKLDEFRAEQEYNMGRSFDSIVGYKEHAALMHYSPTEKSEYKLDKKGMLLIDSGGQYLDGTTDITRTTILGDISDEEKRDFTLVLKGHIGLCNATFLYGATGSNLDILARYPLWKEGIDYKCGTGHGVGYLLNVHEGPQSFSQVPNNVKLESGMIITVEPGIYKENKHGIRIENTVLVKEDKTNEWGKFMKFEVISYCPIDIEGIDITLLDSTEITWLNQYHKEVYNTLSPYLEEREREWLKEKTKNI